MRKNVFLPVLLAMFFVTTAMFGQTRINVEQIEQLGENNFVIGTTGENKIGVVDLTFDGATMQLSVDGVAIGSGQALSGLTDGVATGAVYNVSTNEIDVTVAGGANFSIPLSGLGIAEILENDNNAGGQTITNLAEPSVDSDAATKLYVDSQITSQDFKDDVTASSITPSDLATTITVPEVATGKLFILFKNGILQTPLTDYTIAGSTVTFTVAADGNDLYAWRVVE